MLDMTNSMQHNNYTNANSNQTAAATPVPASVMRQPGIANQVSHYDQQQQSAFSATHQRNAETNLITSGDTSASLTEFSHDSPAINLRDHQQQQHMFSVLINNKIIKGKARQGEERREQIDN